MTRAPDNGPDLVAFPVAPELMRRAEAAVTAIRDDPSDEEHVAELVAVVLELTDRGMDFFYLEPLRRAEAGAMTTSAARLGIATAGRGIPPIVHRVIGSLDEEQLLAVAGFIDEILVRRQGR